MTGVFSLWLGIDICCLSFTKFQDFFGSQWEDDSENELHVSVKQTSTECYLGPDVVFPRQVTKWKPICYLFVQLAFTSDWAVSWFKHAVNNSPKVQKSVLK